MTTKPGSIEESTIPDPIKSSDYDKLISDAEAMASHTDPRMAMAALYGLPVPTTQELNKEIQKYKSFQTILQNQERLDESIKRAEAAVDQPGVDIDTQALADAKKTYQDNQTVVKAITSKELSPFVDLDDKGNVRIDARTAVNAGVPRDILKAAGISGAKQQIIRINLRKEKESMEEAAAAIKKARSMGSPVSMADIIEASHGEAEAAAFEKQNTRLGDGRYMSNADFESLTPFEKGLARGRGGFTSLEKYWLRKSVPKLSLPIDAKQLYEKSGPEDKFAILKSYGKLPENAQYTGSKDGEPVYRIGDGIDTFVMSGFTEFVVETALPLVRTISKWDEMSASDKALSIAFDVLYLVPFLGAAARGARATTAVTRVGRLAGAARGLGNQLVTEITAPVEMMLHPVRTVKSTVRGAWDVLENVANLRKLPEAVISNTYGTIRIPVLAGWTPDDALRARQQLLSAIEKSGGKGVTLELNGYKFTFNPGALSREAGGLSHATPQGDAFLEGIRVKTKPGMPMTEQGIFVSPEPLPRFTRSTAFGGSGEMPTIFITSPDTAMDAINTSKIYKSRFGKVAELEKKFPVDYQIPQPKQILYTRLGPELTKTVVMLEKPLSTAQIAKLKALAIVEDLKAPFKPALLIENPGKIKGALKFTETIDAREIRELTRMLERSGNRAVARNLKAVWNGLDNAREVTRRETMEATRGRGSARIGVGSLSVGSRTGAADPRTGVADPERMMFTVSAEKIGRTTGVSGKIKNPSPIRITNQEKLDGSKAVRSKSTEATNGKTRVTTKETEESKIRVRRRRDEESKGDSGVPRIPRQDDDQQKKNYRPRSQEESRKRVREAEVAIAWRQGRLHNRNRYDVIVDPFTPKEEYLIIMGQRPRNAKLVKGPRSAYNSAQTITGHLGKAGQVDIPGLMHARLWPEAKGKIGIQFARDANISNRKKVFPLKRSENRKK